MAKLDQQVINVAAETDRQGFEREGVREASGDRIATRDRGGRPARVAELRADPPSGAMRVVAGLVSAKSGERFAAGSLYPCLLLALASLFWAGNVVAGRALSMDGPDQASPAILNTLRWGIAVVTLAPFVWRRLWVERRVVADHIRKLLALATVGIAGYYLLFYLAVETVPAIEAGLLVGAMPAVIMVLGLASGLEKPSGLRVAGLAAALLGSLVTVMSHAAGARGPLHGADDAVIVAAVLCWSVYTILLRRWKIPLSTLVLMFTTAALGLAVTLLAVACEIAAGTASLHLTGHAELLILYVGLFPAIGSTLCWNEAVRRLGVGTPAAFLTLIPVFSTGLAITFLGETVGFVDIACLALVVGGVALVVRNPAP